jgi:hypothetical protein
MIDKGPVDNNRLTRSPLLMLSVSFFTFSICVNLRPSAVGPSSVRVDSCPFAVLLFAFP